MKHYYSDYVNHCWRLFVRYPVPLTDNKAEIENWNACYRVYKALGDDFKTYIKEIYSERESVAYSVPRTAQRHNVPIGEMWDFLHKTEREVAEERGLVSTTRFDKAKEFVTAL